MTEPLQLSPDRTALVIIDLQRGVMGMQVAPHTAGDVLARTLEIAGACRQRGALVVPVHVSFARDGGNVLKTPIDAPGAMPHVEGWDQLVPELGVTDNDVVITKRNWGAFYGTSLDLEMRRRTIDTIILTGIATNFGVESTARDAYERGYAIVFAEDAMASRSREQHEFACREIFRRIGRIRSTAEIVRALGGAA